jgi:hypothetical protein
MKTKPAKGANRPAKKTKASEVEMLREALERYLRAEANNADAVTRWMAAQDDYVSMDPRYQGARERYDSAYAELNAAKNHARAVLLAIGHAPEGSAPARKAQEE